MDPLLLAAIIVLVVVACLILLMIVYGIGFLMIMRRFLSLWDGFDERWPR